MAHATFVKKARKNYKAFGIKRGDSYYWWKFRYGGKQMSKEAPKPAQLTQSPFLGTLYDLQSQLQDLSNSSSFNSLGDDLNSIISEIEFLRDEQEEKLNNMPDHLQETSSSGEILRERQENLNTWVSDLEAIDTDIDRDLSEEEREEKFHEICQEISSTEYPG